MFRENNVEHERINYFAEPLTKEKLHALLRKMNLTPFEVLRKNEAIFKESNLSPQTASEEIIKLIVRYPNLLQRPIVEIGDKAVLARPIERAIDLINSANK